MSRRAAERQRRAKRAEIAPVPFHRLVRDLAPTRRGAEISEYETLLPPPVYRVDTTQFKRFLRDFQKHVEGFERYYRDGRSKAVIRQIERVGFAARYGSTMKKLVRPIVSEGRPVPFLNPVFFNGKTDRALFWKLAALSARMWRIETKKDAGRHSGSDTKTAALYRSARAEYARIKKTMPYDSERARARELAERMRALGVPWTPKHAERVARSFPRRPRR